MIIKIPTNAFMIFFLDLNILKKLKSLNCQLIQIKSLDNYYLKEEDLPMV